MAEKKVTRKLAAILATDMVGFSRLMEKDEEGTIARQKAHRAELIDPKITEYGGRVVKSTGDGLLVEFASAVDAVRCAAEVQRAMPELEADIPEDRRIAYRMGVNIGDIVIDGDDILGDGVNIAARLQMLADPGGICISRTVLTHVRNKVALGFVELGPQKVKNIEEPVLTYRVLLDPAEAGTVVAAKEARPGRLRRAAGAASVVLLLVGAGIVWWQPWVAREEPARLDKMAYPLPKKPSIAVLPFANLSGDKKQNHLADGLTEEIITGLSKISALFVSARNSTFTYKGKAVKVRRVAEELGVRYVLEGSLQRSGDRIRVTAQLIDAVKGHHMWAERYDRTLTDLFTVQDEITRKIVGALEIELTEREVTRARRDATRNVKAWEITRRGIRVFRRITKEDNVRARRMAKEAIALDSQYVNAWNLLAYTHYYDARLGWSGDAAGSLARTEALAKRIVSLAPRHPDNYHLLLQIHMLKGENDKAIAVGEEGVALYPNHSVNIALLAQAMVFSGRAKEAVALMHRAKRLSPHHPWYFHVYVAYAHHELGQHGKAIEALKKALALNPNAITAWVRIAAVYSDAGRMQEARAAARRVLEINPKFSVRAFAKAMPYKDKARLEQVLLALRKAGLPEHPPQALPKKPSIAVLPFTNMSGDRDQEYFADGMTDDLITGLSKVSGLIVVSRTSAFTFKGTKKTIKDIARALGVRYVVEGSVRRAGGKVRINAQLIDATTGGHVWAETFDREYKQIFALQDEVKGKIIEALEVKLTPKQRKRLKRLPTSNLKAYELYLRAESLRRVYYHVSFRYESYGDALDSYDEALALDPDFVDAHVGNAKLSWHIWRLGLSSRAKARAERSLARALALDPDNIDALAIQALIQLRSRNYDTAQSMARGAVARHPRNPYLREVLATVFLASDRLAEARDALKRAAALAERPSPELLLSLAHDHLMLGDADQAVPLLLRAGKAGASQGFIALYLANAYARRDNLEMAKVQLETSRRYFGGVPTDIRFLRRTVAHYRNKRLLENYLNAWRKAGMPETR